MTGYRSGVPLRAKIIGALVLGMVVTAIAIPLAPAEISRTLQTAGVVFLATSALAYLVLECTDRFLCPRHHG